MPNTFTQLYIQLVFAVQHRQALIGSSWKDELYQYITGIVRNKKNKLLAINGMPDHVHLFIGLSPMNAISALVKDIKVASNEWINKRKITKHHFDWQDGFGAFSYSRSQVPNVCAYIEKQEMHHQKITFRQEYKGFLEKFGVAYEQDYLFTFFDDLYEINQNTKKQVE